MACLIAADAAPSEQAPMLSLPPSRPCIAILNPSPSLPIKFSFGTRTLSKKTAAVGYVHGMREEGRGGDNDEHKRVRVLL